MSRRTAGEQHPLFPGADGWTPEEVAVADRLEAGQAAVVSMRRKAPYRNVISWSRERDLLVKIDRSSLWGNPFEIGRDGDRAEVIERYAERLVASPDRIRDARLHLAGRCLACWCAPLPCHGDVLAAVVNATPERLEELLADIGERGWSQACYDERLADRI